MKRKSLIQIETSVRAPITIGDREIIFQSRAATIQLPGFRFVWNRPVQVIARAADGRAQKLIVRDVTRLAQLLIIALGIAGAIWIALQNRE